MAGEVGGGIGELGLQNGRRVGGWGGGGGKQVKFNPYKKLGKAEKVLGMLKGGHNKF